MLRARAAAGALLSILALVAVPARADAKPGPGSLRFLAAYADDAGGVRGIGGVSGVAVAPDSRHVYATGAEDDAVSVFRRSSAGLAFVESDRDGEVEGGLTIDGLDGAAEVAVSADGENVYVAAEKDDAIATFARDEETGALRFIDLERDGVDGVDGIGGASGVAASPDATSVHVTGFDDGAVASFARDPGSGALGFLEFDAVPSTANAFAVTLGPDSAAAYVAGFGLNTVVAFRRDRLTGALAFANALGITEGVLWPNGPVALAASPYGRDLYVAALRDSAINRFWSSASDQELSFAGFVRDGVAGAEGIGLASGVAVAPDATGLYATGAGDDAIAHFTIRDTTGALRYRREYGNGAGGINGLDGASGVAASPDGRRVYAVANGEAGDTLVAFTRRRVPLLAPITARGRQRLRRLKVVTGCSRSCTLSAKARGRTDALRFASGRFAGALADDRRNRIRLRFHPDVLRELRGESAHVRIKLRARDQLGNIARKTIHVRIGS